MLSKKLKMNLRLYGAWAFIVSVLLIMVGSTFELSKDSYKILIGVLIVLGIIVGLLNVSRSEVINYLIAALTFVLLGNYFLIVVLSTFFEPVALSKLFGLLISFIIPSALVVAFSAIFRDLK